MAKTIGSSISHIKVKRLIILLHFFKENIEAKMEHKFSPVKRHIPLHYYLKLLGKPY